MWRKWKRIRIIRNYKSGRREWSSQTRIDLTEHLNTPRQHYRLIEPLEAAAASVPMNIAEGKGRFSKKEFIHFLHIARGSLYETMTLLNLFQRRDWISMGAMNALEAQSNALARMLNALIRSINPE
jgi:four helix bundle protein